jgi:hypothetical protein
MKPHSILRYSGVIVEFHSFSGLTYIVVITRRSVRLTPIELSKLCCPKKFVMWAMIMEIRVGRKVVREKPRSLRSSCIIMITRLGSVKLEQIVKLVIIYGGTSTDPLLCIALGWSLHYCALV